MKTWNSIRTLFVGAGTVFCLCVSFQASPAQTDYSLRTYALSIHLAGIVEDVLTDIYLNPARAGMIERPEAYGVNLPRRSVSIPFPISGQYSSFGLTPVEDYTSSYSYDPIAFNYLLPYGNRFRAAMGFEVAVSNEDEIGSDGDLSIGSDNVLRDYTRYSMTRRQIDHAALNIACASPVGAGYAGIRFEAGYDMEKYQRLNDRLDLRMRADGGSDSYFSQNYELFSRRYETTSFAISAGLYRPQRLISDVVIGCGLTRSLYPATTSESVYENEDYDGNGNGLYGGTPDNLYRESTYDSHRDYRGLSLYGRVHLQLTEALRTVHLLSWSSARGDGAVLFRNIDDERDARDLFDHRIACAYDGDYSTLFVSSAIGHTGEIHDGVSVSLGARGIMIRTVFEESAPGNFSTVILNNDFPDTFSVSGAYTQYHNNDEAYYYFIVPVALEWKLGEYIQLRMGVEFAAAHRDVEKLYQQSVPIEGAPAILNERRGLVDYSLDYETGAYFHNGLSINIRDTLIVDLFYGYSSSLSVASFNHLSVRYLF